MKVFLLVLFACLGAASAQFNRFSQFDSAVNRGLKIRGVDVSAPPAKGIQELYFEQVLDHFNGQNNATWKQRYFVNDQFWDGKGPVLLMIGGEGPISSAYVQDHFITYNYAQQYNALLVALEHRFYGESQPLDASKTENLAYLSSEQALADLAWFREQYGASVGAADKKWIAFGGSYPGCLSGWLRQKYPSSFYGSFAASAPVDAKLDFFEYFEVVERSIGEKCAADFQGASEKLWEMAQTADGRSQIKDLFNLCADLPSDALSLANFMMGLTDPIAEGVQYNEDRGNPSAITPICDAMANATDKIQGWASIVAQTQQGQCMDASYESAVQSLVTPGAARSWTYQTCNEFSFFQTTDSTKQPFSKFVPLKYYYALCDDAFGTDPLLRPRIDQTNTIYGSRNYRGTRTHFSNGSIDPWHALGILSADGLPKSNSATFIQGTAHCADLYGPAPSDSQALIEARATQARILAEWLASDEP